MSCFETKGPCESNIGTRARWRLLGMVLLVFGMIGTFDARSEAADGTAFVLWAHAPTIAHGHETACAVTDADGSAACPAVHGTHSCLAEPASIVSPPPQVTAEDCRTRLPWHSLSRSPDPPPPRVRHAL